MLTAMTNHSDESFPPANVCMNASEIVGSAFAMVAIKILLFINQAMNRLSLIRPGIAASRFIGCFLNNLQVNYDSVSSNRFRSMIACTFPQQGVLPKPTRGFLLRSSASLTQGTRSLSHVAECHCWLSAYSGTTSLSTYQYRPRGLPLLVMTTQAWE